MRYISALLFVSSLACFSACVQSTQIDLSNDSSHVSLNELHNKKKYKTSICALFKNEADYLKEWIEYHLMVGIDHFYLYNNSSIDGYMKILSPYIKEGIVTIIYWPNYLPDYLVNNPTAWALSTQTTAYENAAKHMALKQTEWLIVLEVNEFIVPVNADSIVAIVEKYSDCSSIKLKTDFFTASNKNDYVINQLLIESIHLTAEGKFPTENKVEKMMFKPDDYTFFTWPPYQCHFKESARIDHLSKGEIRINKYQKRAKGTLNFGKVKRKLHIDNRAISTEETAGLLQVGYEIEDQERAIFRFVPELKKKMNLDHGWNW